MGWRSWNLFGANVNQDLIQSQVSKSLSIVVINLLVVDQMTDLLSIADGWNGLP